MSREALERVISQATMDVGFRRTLLLNPGQLLDGFDLTREEAAALRNLTSEDLESPSNTLYERLFDKKAAAMPRGDREPGWLSANDAEGSGPSPVAGDNPLRNGQASAASIAGDSAGTALGANEDSPDKSWGL